MLNEIIKMIELSKNTKGQDWRHNIKQIKTKINEYAKEYHESNVKELNIPDVTNRTCVTCLYCQANPSSEFRYDKHKCTLVKPFVNVTDATKFVCDDWTEIPFYYGC